MKHRFYFVPATALTLLGGPPYATVYLTLEQAQSVLFPGAKLTPEFRTLTSEQAKAIEKQTGVNVRSKEVKIWRASTGGWFIADEVVGKHEFIPFALALDENGAVKGIEILEYREAYGGDIRNPKWRAQFTGKKAGEKLRLGKDIRNISGATLSCRHITDGVSRLLATYAVLFGNGRS
jgi:Na+-translocating ferredoxin:NAD+ oxidoreductase RnfG subunit